MTTPRKTSNDKLVSTLRILAGEIESPDGVANMAIGEGADRIEELAAELARVTAQRDQFVECVNKSESVAERGNLVGEVQSLRARVAELEERAERYRLVTLRQDATIAELVAALRDDADSMDGWEMRVGFRADGVQRLCDTINATGSEAKEAAEKIRAVLAQAKPADLVQEACGGRCGDPYCNLSTEGELMRDAARKQGGAS